MNYLQKGRLNLRGSGISPRGKSPKLRLVGALENCKKLSLWATLDTLKLAARHIKIVLQASSKINYLLSLFVCVSFDKIIGAWFVAAEAPGSSDDRSL